MDLCRFKHERVIKVWPAKELGWNENTEEGSLPLLQQERRATLLSLHSAHDSSLTRVCLLIIVQPLQIAAKSDLLNPGYLVTPEPRLAFKEKRKIQNLKCSPSEALRFQPLRERASRSARTQRVFDIAHRSFPKSISTWAYRRWVTQALSRVSDDSRWPLLQRYFVMSEKCTTKALRSSFKVLFGNMI